MSVRKFKNSLILLAVVLMICASVKITADTVRIELETAVPVVSEGENIVEKDDLSQFRTEREQLRQMQKSQLNDIIHDESTEESVVRSAQEQLMGILEAESLEVTLEGILRMRGFVGAIVAISDKSVNVLIRSEGIEQTQTAVILDLITTETGISGGNVKIIPIN